MSGSPFFEAPTEFRDLAARSVEQARKAFESFLGATQRAAGVAGGAVNASEDGVKSITAHVLACTEQNMNAAFDLAQKLIKVKDPQEAFTLQGEYLKTQVETLQAQAKELGAAVQKSLIPGFH
jgi:phasin